MAINQEILGIGAVGRSDSEYRAMLKTQMGFLTRSAAMFDEGHYDEALRIAVIVNTLLYDTSNATSLLTHLGIKRSVRLLSTIMNPMADLEKFGFSSDPPPLVMYRGVGLTKVRVGGPTSWEPKLGSNDFQEYLPVKDWLENPVEICNGYEFTRYKFIDMAANREGGKHIQADLPEEYRFALTHVGLWSSTGAVAGPGAVHFIALRDIAYELLNSSDLLNAADP